MIDKNLLYIFKFQLQMHYFLCWSVEETLHVYNIVNDILKIASDIVYIVSQSVTCNKTGSLKLTRT